MSWPLIAILSGEDDMNNDSLTKEQRVACDDCGMEVCDCGDYYDDDELECTWCGGEGIQENDDPLWHGFDRDWIPCECCNGTGLRKHQTVF
jgi:DnaJ-class molecular chaperone